MASKAILLVEDNPDDEALTLRVFKKNNISNQVIVAHDGVEALDYLFANGSFSEKDPYDLPAVVLLDLKLPKVNGLQVLTRIRANEVTKYLPVVILTSSKEEQDIINSYNFGANSFVRKPVEFDTFNEAVHNLGLYWLLLNEPPIGKKRN